MKLLEIGGDLERSFILFLVKEGEGDDPPTAFLGLETTNRKALEGAWIYLFIFWMEFKIRWSEFFALLFAVVLIFWLSSCSYPKRAKIDEFAPIPTCTHFKTSAKLSVPLLIHGVRCRFY